MTKSELEIKVTNYLKRYEEVDFALFFGSFVSGRFGNKSDLDVGIFYNKSLDLLLIGRIVTDLEEITNLKIDLLELNDIYKKHPLLAYQIATNYKLLFSKNEDCFVNFKRNAFLYYFDTERLRKSVNSAFNKRISSKNFGKRNYA
jgi:predicted nucleotidyltransferase